MGYLDYTPPKAWGGLGEQAQANLFKIGELLQKQRTTAAYEEQIAAQNKALAEKALKDKTDEALKQSDRLKDITAGATAYLGKGRRGAAEALVKSSQFPNPRDPGGPLLGMTWDEEKPGPAPTAPVAPEEPLPDFVQVMTPQQARTKAIHDSLLRQGRPVDQPPAANDLATEAAATEAEGLAQRTQDARQQFPAKKALYDSEATAYAAKKKAYDDQVANPNVILGSPYGGKTTIHPSEERDYQRQDMIDRATKLFADAAKEPDPHTRATMLRSANLLMDEIPNFEKSIIANTASASQAQEGRLDLQGNQIASNEKIAKMKADAKGKGKGGKGAVWFEMIAKAIKMKEDALGPHGEVLDPNVNSKIAEMMAPYGIPSGGKDGWGTPVGEITRGRSISQRGELRDQALVSTDEENNKNGEWKNPVEAKKGTQADVDFARVRDRLTALKKDILANGDRVMDREAINRRKGLAGEVVTALRAYNNLSSTDASVQLEKDIQGAMGTPGDGWLWGADANVIEHMLQGAITWHRQAQSLRMKPGTFRESPGAPPAAAPAAPNKAQNVAKPLTTAKAPSAGGKLHDDNAAVKAARKMLLKNPKDQDALDILELNGASP